MLRGAGIQAEEGALAIAAHTSQLTGTPEDQLIAAVADLHGIEGRFRRVGRIDELRGTEPFVRVGDPLMGERVMSMAAFNTQWRGTAILFPDLFHQQGD